MFEKKFNSVVSVRKCENYDYAETKIKEIINDLDISGIFQNKKILFKVNLMLANRPEKAINTHPEFVRAAVRVAKTFGGVPYIGESSGAYGFTQEAFRVSGIEKVAYEEKIDIINFDACQLAKVNVNGKIIKEIYLPKILRDMDILVSLPKLKTHRLLLYTGALKNQVGLIPGCHKAIIHLISNNIEELAQAIIDLNAHVKFNLAIMDGVMGQEGEGPTSGSLVKSNFIAASKDLVSLDAVCCQIIGLKPEDVLTNSIAEQRGLGTCNLDKINIKGDYKKIGVIPFKIPTYKNDIRKHKIYNYLYFRLRSKVVRPLVIYKLCRDCKKCFQLCPTGAIKSGRLPIDKKKCIYCFLCYESCPYGAIKLKCPWYLKTFFKKKLKNFLLDNLV